jgi:flagellar biosynthesis/type III secretory pathway protein FliH
MPSFDRIIPQEQASQFVTLKMPSLSNKSVLDSGTLSSALQKPMSKNDKPGDAVQIAYKKGYSAGYSQAEHDTQRLLDARVTQLVPLLKSANEQVTHLKSENARRILELAVALAEQIVRAEVKTNATCLMEVIRESVLQIAESVSRIELRIHPADAGAVREEIGREESRMTIIEDSDIAQGGCRIVTSQGDIDATLIRRINAARIALGLTPAMEGENLDHALPDDPMV